jgi:hypothetical protein
MLSRGELKGMILRKLGKSPANPGFYDEARLNEAIQECLDYVAVEMFMEGQGWQNRIGFLDTASGQVTLDVPAHMAIIREVRIKCGDDYVPLYHEEQMGRTVGSPSAGAGALYPASYRIVDNAFLFSTPLAEGASKGLMVEYAAFPAYLSDDVNFIPRHFNAAMVHFIKYRAASILLSNHGDPNPAWSAAEIDWYGKMRFVIAKRNSQPIYIREFEG